MAKTDHTNHFSGDVTQKALIRKNGKILLVRYPPGDLAADKLDMPGGRLHQGELPIDGLLREVKEEIGADVTIRKVLATGIFTNLANVSTYFVVYEASLIDEQQQFIAEEGEIGEIGWFDEKEFFALPIIYGEYQKALKSVFDNE